MYVLKSTSKVYYFFSILFLGFASLAQNLPQSYYPRISGELIEHTYYALDYNETHEQANWVIYFAEYSGATSRNDRFKADPLVSTQSSQLEDFKNSGYDRGHLAPAADMSISTTAMTESFYLSNMSPQNPSFNRGIWKELEALVRNWSVAENTPFDLVITGPILKDDSCGTIGNHVTIPCSYYKIYANVETCSSIGFVLKNEASNQPLTHFSTSIDDIEVLTGIDFFASLSADIQLELESQKDSTLWNWGIKNQEISHTSEDSLNTIQCKGITQSGHQCSRSAQANGFCWQHKPK